MCSCAGAVCSSLRSAAAAARDWLAAHRSLLGAHLRLGASSPSGAAGGPTGLTDDRRTHWTLVTSPTPRRSASVHSKAGRARKHTRRPHTCCFDAPTTTQQAGAHSRRALQLARRAGMRLPSGRRGGADRRAAHLNGRRRARAVPRWRWSVACAVRWLLARTACAPGAGGDLLLHHTPRSASLRLRLRRPSRLRLRRHPSRAYADLPPTPTSLPRRLTAASMAATAAPTDPKLGTPETAQPQLQAGGGTAA
ncbi:hypothetical protein SVAN01_08467, partial [Stagonosporopsis vannaccii]